MTALTADARSVLGGLAPWAIAQLLLDPREQALRLRQSMWGGSHARLANGTTAFYDCRKRGINVFHLKTVGDDVVHTDLFTITWADIAEHARRIPPEVRAELQAACDAQNATFGTGWSKAANRVSAARRAALEPIEKPTQLDLFAGAAS